MKKSLMLVFVLMFAISFVSAVCIDNLPNLEINPGSTEINLNKVIYASPQQPARVEVEWSDNGDDCGGNIIVGSQSSSYEGDSIGSPTTETLTGITTSFSKVTLFVGNCKLGGTVINVNYLTASQPASGTSCLDCLTNNDCSTGQICQSGTCVVDNSCTSDSDCSNGEVCQSNVCVDPTPASVFEWRNLLGENITHGAVQVNDTVLIVETNSLAGTEFNLVEDDGSLGTDIIFLNKVSRLIGSDSILPWKFDQNTLDLGSDWDFNPLYPLKFYFVHDFVQSSILDINKNSNDNSAPTANIVSPVNGSDLSVGSSVSFIQNSSDEDDLLNITWDFGDETSETFNGCSFFEGICNTTHVYDTPGSYEVTLIAEEETRVQKDFQTIRLNVYKEGINVVPIISSPDSVGIQDRVVLFDASQSFVVDCTYDDVEEDFIAGDLDCVYVHEAGTEITDDYDLILTWTITPQNEDSKTVQGNWNEVYGGDKNYYKFYELFEEPGRHRAELNLEYVENAQKI